MFLNSLRFGYSQFHRYLPYLYDLSLKLRLFMATIINTIYRLTMLFSGFSQKYLYSFLGMPRFIIITSQINASQFIVFFVLSVCKLLNELKTMYCDRSAYYQKAIKATSRRLIINTYLQWLFLLFGRLVYNNKNE